MSNDKIEKILATYPPVKDKPGYVWWDKTHIVKLKTLRSVYEEEFEESAHGKESKSNKSDDARDKNARDKGSSEDT